MSKKVISNNEQRKLRGKAKKELERLEKIDKETVELIDRFKYKFNICETVYKIILKEYKKSKGEDVNKNQLHLNMNEIPAALNYAGYPSKDYKLLLKELFASKRPDNKKGKTAKILRNEVTHGINNSAVTEIIDRQTELFNYMDTFIDFIKESIVNEM